MKPVRNSIDNDVFDKVLALRGCRHQAVATVSNDVWSKAVDAVDIPLKYPVYIKLKKAANDETNQS